MNNYIVIPLTEAILKAGDRVRLVEPEILIERSKSDIKYTQDHNGIYSFEFKNDFIFFKTSQVIDKMLTELGPRYADRKGGYTRIVTIKNRVGDGAEEALIEFV